MRFILTNVVGVVTRVIYAADAETVLPLEGETLHQHDLAVEGDWFSEGIWTKRERPPEPVTIAMVKTEQGRRLRYTDWAVARAADPTDGRPVPDEIVAQRQAIRAGAEALEAMDPIPHNFRDCSFWGQSAA